MLSDSIVELMTSSFLYNLLRSQKQRLATWVPLYSSHIVDAYYEVPTQGFLHSPAGWASISLNVKSVFLRPSMTSYVYDVIARKSRFRACAESCACAAFVRTHLFPIYLFRKIDNARIRTLDLEYDRTPMNMTL